ncbi:MAG: MTH938/NDUFAF3 family protein [Pseudomonadota bacterium]|nr:MTH938/NDUFAF3 family protein [Pseudomonadota bacterium]
MRFTQDLSSNVNVVRGYRQGELRINGEVFTNTMIVAAASLRAEPALADVADLTADHAARLLEFEPELVLIGTGGRQVFPEASFGARFLKSGIGFEVMNTGAACRTFNVLVSEQRRVVALLIP